MAPTPAVSADTEARMRHLETEIRRHSELYYAGQPEITDPEFDALWNELAELEAAHPQLKADDTPTERISDGISELFAAVRHDVPMLSLDKAYERDEVHAFLDRFPGQTMATFPKFDGISGSARYENGRLVRFATRGDGEVGEDVTANARGMRNLPEQLSEPVTCEVRGEVVMLRSDWRAYNDAHPDKPLANPRNAAAGTMRAKDRAAVADRPLTFMPFDLIEPGVTHDVAQRIRQLGFEVTGDEITDRADAVFAYMERIERERPDYDFELDGVVIRLADRAAYEAAGQTGHHPRGAIAWKPAAVKGQSRLNSVTWQVGKSGRVAPVAEIEPVFLAGTTIRRATLHNIVLIEERDIRIGDRITLIRAGDVIPQVIGPLLENRTGDEQVITVPDACPSCGGPLVEVGESRLLQCENTQGCPAQAIRRLIHWASRAAADIDAVGKEWIEVFNDMGLLARPSDFYTRLLDALRAETERLAADPKATPRFRKEHDGGRFTSLKTTGLDRMIASIETSKTVGMRKAIIGWSIPFCSEGTAKRLCRAGYENVEAVMAATVDDLVQVEDIGPVVAESAVTFFALEDTKTEIATLRDAGVNLDVRDEDRPAEAPVDSPFAGRTFVFTGKLESFERKTGEQLVERAGGKASGSVSAKTDVLVAGPGAGSKLAKATKLNEAAADKQGVSVEDPAFVPAVEVLDEQGFLALVQQAGVSL